MRRIRRSVGRFLRKCGWQRVGQGPIWLSPAEVASRLREYGLRGAHIVDVGAHRGNYSRSLLEVFPEAYVTMFEPQVELHQFMADLAASKRVSLVGKGVGATSGEFPFTRHERSDSQSFSIGPDEAQSKGWMQDVLQVVSLDDHLAGSQWPRPDVVKIDAEGWDLEVLKGGARTLAEAVRVFMEASVVRPLAPHLLAVLEAMGDAGYAFLGMTDVLLNARGFPWYAEVAMVRKNSAVYANMPRSL